MSDEGGSWRRLDCEDRSSKPSDTPSGEEVEEDMIKSLYSRGDASAATHQSNDKIRRVLNLTTITAGLQGQNLHKTTRCVSLGDKKVMWAPTNHAQRKPFSRRCDTTENVSARSKSRFSAAKPMQQARPESKTFKDLERIIQALRSEYCQAPLDAAFRHACRETSSFMEPGEPAHRGWLILI